jgi:hypothetical protein
MSLLILNELKNFQKKTSPIEDRTHDLIFLAKLEMSLLIPSELNEKKFLKKKRRQ